MLSSPIIIRLPVGVEFNRTYSSSLEEVRALRCYAELHRMSEGLQGIDPENQILFFGELLNDEFTGQHLHKLFSVLRLILADTSGQQMAAMYAPLGYVGRKGKGFPLHADLYFPNMLWNVFDQVPGDGSGASTFLPASIFRDLLGQNYVSARHRAKLTSCLEDDSCDDRFRTFYDLLYVQGTDWSDKLCSQMSKEQFIVPLRYGQGYLLHDRKWLHGREAPSRGITVKRVHRLIFFSRCTMAKV